jgi:membrane protein DedA with SNARE-associated domain
MLTGWTSLWQGFEAALAGMAAPWFICTALVLTTLLLEDLAIAAGVAVAAQGSVSWEASFVSVAGGIAIGDLGLYAFGLAATRVPWLQHRYGGARNRWPRAQLVARLPSAVLLARVIPGLRLVTYTACGWLRIPFVLFSAWVGLAVLLWTAGLYAVSVALGDLIARQWNVPAPLAVALPIVALAAGFPLVRAIRNRLNRSST